MPRARTLSVSLTYLWNRLIGRTDVMDKRLRAKTLSDFYFVRNHAISDADRSDIRLHRRCNIGVKGCAGLFTCRFF